MRSILRFLLWPIPNSWANRILRWVTKLAKSFYTADADVFIELLLHGMSWAFVLCRSYRRSNLRNFSARYVFETEDGKVHSTADFAGGAMNVQPHAAGNATACVTFRSVDALRGFLFSGNQDILIPILSNDVLVGGNLNYIYRFGFMARDLARRLNIEL